MNRKLQAAATFVLAATIIAPVSGACPNVGSPAQTFTLPPLLTELSGIGESIQNPGVFYTHNDSGDSARLYALNASGALRAIVSLSGVTATDWEDMAMGPVLGSETPYIHVADSGNNNLTRTTLQIHRFAEPIVAAEGGVINNIVISNIESFTFRYPDANHDSEALIWDPHQQVYYVITRDRVAGSGQASTSRVYRAVPASTTGTHTMEFVISLGDLFGHRTKAADLNNGRLALLQHSIATRSTRVLYWNHPPGASITSTLIEAPCLITVADYDQAEALAFSATGDRLIVGSEGMSQIVRIYPWKDARREGWVLW